MHVVQGTTYVAVRTDHRVQWLSVVWTVHINASMCKTEAAM